MKKILIFISLLFAAIAASGQNPEDEYVLHGKVMDQNGEPLTGVLVFSENSFKGGVSDENGNFSMDTWKGDRVSATILGFVTQTFEIAGQDNVVIRMEQDIEQLEETVVIGYGTINRKELTSSVSTVKAESLNKVVGTTVSNALKGKVTGLRIYSTSGAPGTQASITIRGGSSINKSNEALILIDGVPGSLSNVNPQDIASVEVLKDAASTAIYGSRASNGIIMITTKEGSNQKLTVNANVSYGYQNASKRIDRLNAEEYLSVVRPALARSQYASLLTQAHPAGTGNTETSAFSTRYLRHGETLADGWRWMWDPISPRKVLIFEDNDIEDELFEGGSIINAYLSLNGGNDRNKYMISAGYVGDTGYTPERSWDNITFRANNTYSITRKLKLISNISAYRTMSVPYANEAAIFSRGVHLSPAIRGVMADGTDSPGWDQNYQNPVYLINNIVNKRNDYGFRGILGLEYEIIDGLKAKVSGSYNAAVMHREYFEKANVYNNLRNANYYGSIDQTSQIDITLNYDKTFRKDHKISAVAGVSSLYYNIYDYNAQAHGGSKDDIYTLNAASEYDSATSTRERERMNSFFARATYSWKEKYLLTASIRGDGSSRFARGNRWGWFPGISAGYVMTEEPFMQDARWLSLLKIRASYGATGNNSVGRFDYQGLWGSSTAYVGASTWLPSDIPNTALTWETSSQADVGLDISFLENRINLVLDYYDKITSNLLFNDKLPNTSGFGSVDKNIGKVRFWGFEAQIDARLISRKNFSWDFGANVSWNMNKVLKLPDNGNYKNRVGGVQFSDDYYAGVGGIAEGERMYSVVGYKVSHILDTAEEAANAMYDERAGGYDPATGTKEQGRKIAGDYEWVDKSGDGMITPKDQYVLGYLVPTTTGGFNTSFRIYNFEVYANFDYALGHVIYDRQISLVNAGMQDGTLTPTKDVLDYWQKEGDAAGTEYARFDINDGSNDGQWNHYRTSDRNTYKGDYLSFREFKVAYNFSHKLLNKARIQQCQIYLSGQNLYCWSEYPGYMTEYSSSNRNLSDGNYPQPRIFTLGLNITF